MDQRINRWDFAWKTFCNPVFPWCKWFISRLIGDQYSDFYVQCGELSDIDTELHSQDMSTFIADKILSVTVNNVTRRIHLEFQSRNDKGMALRMLQYGVSMARPEESGHVWTEAYSCPDAFIVQVLGVPGSAPNRREVTLVFNDQQVTASYPVIFVTDKIPEVRRVMQADSYSERDEAVFALGKECGAITGDAAQNERFYRACCLISNPKAFVGCIPEEDVRKEVTSMSQAARNYIDEYGEKRWKDGVAEGVTKGLQEAIQRLMQTQGISENDARRMLGLESKGGSRKSNLGTMGLK